MWLRRLLLEIEERLLDMLISRAQAIAYGKEKEVTRNSIFALTRLLETRGAHRGYAPRKAAVIKADRQNIVQAITWATAIIPEEDLRHEVISRAASRLAGEADHNERWEGDDGREVSNGNGNGNGNGAEGEEANGAEK